MQMQALTFQAILPLETTFMFVCFLFIYRSTNYQSIKSEYMNMFSKYSFLTFSILQDIEKKLEGRKAYKYPKNISREGQEKEENASKPNSNSLLEMQTESNLLQVKFQNILSVTK